MADIFISYKKSDKGKVRLLVDALEAQGFDVWWDTELQSGDRWLNRIIKEVRAAKCVIGFWTDAALTEEGTFVPSKGDGRNYMEIEHHEAGVDKIIGLIFDEDAIPVHYRDIQHVSMLNWPDGENADYELKQLFRSLHIRLRSKSKNGNQPRSRKSMRSGIVNSVVIASILIALTLGVSIYYGFGKLASTINAGKENQVQVPNPVPSQSKLDTKDAAATNILSVNTPAPNTIAEPSKPDISYITNQPRMSAINPGYNCHKNGLSAVEKVICTDADLASGNRFIDVEYSRVFKSSSGQIHREILESQRNYLSNRDACIVAPGEPKDCIKQLMHDQYSLLKGYD